jgi:hypothetical protein
MSGHVTAASRGVGWVGAAQHNGSIITDSLRNVPICVNIEVTTSFDSLKMLLRNH